MKTLTLPDLGEGLTEAEIRTWYVKEGDTLALDQPMVAVETAKAIVDIPSPFAGKLIKCFGSIGDSIRTGQPLATFDCIIEESIDETTEDSVENNTENNTENHSEGNSDSTPTPPPPSLSAQAIKATPAVRALAKRLQVNLDTLAPKREDGVITPQDVQQAAEIAKQRLPSIEDHDPHYTNHPLRGTQRHMALTLNQAHQSVVPVTLTDEAIMPHWNKTKDMTLTLIKAIITACQAEPKLNAHFLSETLILKQYNTIHLGIAIDTPNGLYMPVLKSVEAMNDAQRRQRINEFKVMAQQQTFRPDLLSEATLILSNFGSIGGRYATPMVIPPAVAIIGVGRLYHAVVAENNTPAVRPSLPISLTVDHRAVTGGEAARFLNSLINALTQEDRTCPT